MDSKTGKSKTLYAQLVKLLLTKAKKKYIKVSEALAKQHSKNDICIKSIGRKVSFGRAIEDFDSKEQRKFWQRYNEVMK